MKRALAAIFVVAILLAWFGTQMQKAGSMSEHLTSSEGRSIDLIDVQTGSDSVSLGVDESFSVDVVLDGVTDFLNKYEVAIVFDNTSVKCTGADVPRYDQRYVFSGENFTMGFVSVLNWQGIALAGSSLLPHMYVVQDGVTPLLRYVNVSGERLLCRFSFTVISSGMSKIELGMTVNESIPFNTFLMDINNRTLGFTPKSFQVNVSAPMEVQAEAHIMPKVLNLRGHGKYVTVLIRFAESTKGMKVNVSSILLNSTIAAERRPVLVDVSAGLLMIKFDRQTLIDLITNSEPGDIHRKTLIVTLTVTGKFRDGTGFEAYDTIWVILRGSFPNVDG